MKCALVSACALALAALAVGPQARAESLYGVTLPDVSGNASLVTVNTATGAATSLFTFALSSNFNNPLSLAFDPTSEKFIYSSSSSTTGGSIAVIDPITHTVAEHAITGLPAGQLSTAGLEYDPVFNSLVITFGASGTFTQNRIAKIDLSGTVLAVSPTLAVADADYLAFNPLTSQLAIVDLNDLGVVYVSDPFGSPSYTSIAPSPSDIQFGDGAFSSAGTLFIERGTTLNPNDLYQLQGTSYVKIGAFGLAQQVDALAFATVPEPASLLLLGAGGLLTLRLRRQRARLSD